MNPRKLNQDAPKAQPLLGQGTASARDQHNAPRCHHGAPPPHRVADEVLSCVIHVVNHAMAEVNSAAVCSQDQLELIVARHSLRWRLPRELFPMALDTVSSWWEQVRAHERTIEDSLHPSSPRRYPTVAYVVFYHGRTCIFYDTLPADILDLRKEVLFWIDHSKNEVWSRGKPLAKGEGLQPRAEDMLRFLCRFERAGHTIPLSDLFIAVWTPTASPRPEAARNNISVQQNAINTFAGETFILTASPDSQHDEKKILRLRGKAAYTIGSRAYEELCIIRATRCQ